MVKIISLGADPEIFAQNDKELVSAIGLVGGTKEEPRAIEGYPGFGIQEDNVAVEMTIPPSYIKEQFVHNIQTSVQIAHDQLPEGTYLSKKCSHHFDEKFLQSKKACEFGCSPEYNAYELVTFATSPNKDTPNFRTCGGHVHIGMEKIPRTERAIFVRALDLFLGVPSLLLDKDTERRQLYGKAGSCRFKKYGLEYRVLSNFWIFDTDTIEWVWNQVHNAAEFYNNHKDIISESYYELPLLIKHAIDNSDLDRAKDLISNYKIEMPNGYSNSDTGETRDREDVLNEKLRPTENSLH